MADEIVIAVPTPESPASPVEVVKSDPGVAPEVVEVIHDDARDLGYALSEINRLSVAQSELDARMIFIEGTQAAQLAATSAIVGTVEDIAETVEEIASDDTDDEPEPEPAPGPENDTPPGKKHWLYRSGKEWRGRGDQ